MNDTAISPLSSDAIVAVIGAGAMGAGIAQIAAAAGHPVQLFDANPETARKAVEGIGRNFERLAEKGKISPENARTAAARIQPAGALTDLASAALIVEAIVENLEVKRKVFAELEDIVGDSAILASNTSSISITAIGAVLRRPQRLLGMHFFNPAPVMELVEIVSGLATDPQLAQATHATAAAWGKVPVYARSTPGFIVNRVARPYYAEGLRLLHECAATPETIDAVMRDAGGFRMGPFELMDLIGHDVNFAVTSSVFGAYFNDQRFTPSLIQQELVSAGYLGRKSGRGFYDYTEGAARPAAATEPTEAPPAQVSLADRGDLANALRRRLSPSSVAIADAAPERGDVVAEFMVDGQDASICLTDGRSATRRSAETHTPNLVLADLALDFAQAKRVALSRADQCSETAWHSAVGLFQAAGFAVSRLDDIPGLAVMRTVAMLANEAADAVNQGVCNARDADLAMCKGTNYPLGPLAWADVVGVGIIRDVLAALAEHYGEDRYRISPLLQRKVWTQGVFHAR